ncbi:MAG: ACP S-malonyltransferase [Granulosicoccus sp.]
MTFAVVFPGQGSQSVGMLAELAAEYPVVGETFAEAADALGTDLWAISRDGPAEVLADTRVTQPLMFTSGVALWRALIAAGLPQPAVVAGHSLGEFSAMVAAGALSFSDGLAVVQRRAELMATAVAEGEGGMAALIGMDDEAVVELCQSLSGERVVEAVNFNAPGQVAISGHLDALEKVMEAARGKGARKAIMLAVSVPNHSSLMQPAGAQLATFLDTIDIAQPQIPLVQNATAAVAESRQVLVERLREHVYSPVYWTQSIQTLIKDFSVQTIIECGPGKVLSGLGKRIDRTVPTLPVESPEALQAAVAAVSAASANA